MRHPQLNHHIALAEAELPKIMQEVGLSEDTPLVRNSEGWVNLCYLSEDVVIRFNARDPKLPKFQREAFVYRQLGAQDIPTPELVLYDDTGRFGGYPVIVTKRLPGRSLDVSWPDLSADVHDCVARNAGRMLARLHRQEFSTFGEVFAPEYSSWSDYLMARIEGLLRDIHDIGIFDGAQAKRIEETVSHSLQLFSEVPGPTLVHGDYHFGNLLHQGEEIVGVVDFEWSFAGDPAWDLIRASKMDRYWPGSGEAFRQGYGELRAWTPELDRRSELYRMVHLLEIAIVAARFYTSEEANSYRKRVLAQLDSLLESNLF